MEHLEFRLSKGTRMSDQPRVPAGSPRGGQWVKLYHGTSKAALAGIMQHGIRAESGVAWATDSRDVAEQFAWSKDQETPVVIEIEAPENTYERLDPILLLPVPSGTHPPGDLRAAFRSGVKPEWIKGSSPGRSRDQSAKDTRKQYDDALARLLKIQKKNG
jgi:hypothetical protein